MVYNAMYPIRQNPYPIRDNRAFVKQKEDEESSKSAYTSEEQQEEVLPQYKQRPAENFPDNSQGQAFVQQQLKESREAQSLAQSSFDTHLKNSTINIAQIIKDFKNTAAAIGTPPELSEEVNSYITLIEAQVTKENPNVKLVKSNLKNAASLLDNYITETLQRPSQVVENWLDALFLQQINYKHDQNQINPQFLVKFPDKKTGEIAEEPAKDTETLAATPLIAAKKTVIVPEDEQLKSLFIQAKKLSYSNQSEKAMAVFQQALDRAVEVKDNDTQSKVLYEIGKIYDSKDYLSQALTSYNQSLSTTDDVDIKTRAHFSMAQIYDDVAQLEPAINHYMSSISYAGESDNFSAQSTSLAKIGNIFTDKYDKEAFDFYSEAQLIAAEGKDSKVKGYVSSSVARAYTQFNEPQKALKSYSEAIQQYTDAQSPLKVAVNYQKAAELMQDLNNTQKAKSLLQKALASATQSGNTKLVSEINAQLSTM